MDVGDVPAQVDPVADRDRAVEKSALGHADRERVQAARAQANRNQSALVFDRGHGAVETVGAVRHADLGADRAQLLHRWPERDLVGAQGEVTVLPGAASRRGMAKRSLEAERNSVCAPSIRSSVRCRTLWPPMKRATNAVWGWL
jgi:hypothetical protein